MSKSTMIICLVVAIFLLAYLSTDKIGGVHRSLGWRSVHSKMGYNYENSKSEKLARVLRKARTDDRTVIITTLDEAWASPNNSIFDMFLESFRIGEQTDHFLNHLVVLATDPIAFARCKSLHNHCFFLTTESNRRGNMSLHYLKTWSRLELLKSVLELGLHGCDVPALQGRWIGRHRSCGVYQDADIMWLRNPLSRIPAGASLAIATHDVFKKKKNSSDKYSHANCGFVYAFSNSQTLQFFNYWLFNRIIYPDKDEQQIFDIIRLDAYVTTHLALELEFLDTDYFGGFCQPISQLLDFNRVCTMQAKYCCDDVVKMEEKVEDLRDLLRDWKIFKGKTEKERRFFSWSTVPNKCKLVVNETSS